MERFEGIEEELYLRGHLSRQTGGSRTLFNCRGSLVGIFQATTKHVASGSYSRCGIWTPSNSTPPRFVCAINQTRQRPQTKPTVIYQSIFKHFTSSQMVPSRSGMEDLRDPAKSPRSIRAFLQQLSKPLNPSAQGFGNSSDCTTDFIFVVKAS